MLWTSLGHYYAGVWRDGQGHVVQTRLREGQDDCGGPSVGLATSHMAEIKLARINRSLFVTMMLSLS
jgi:hypothetical protein